MDNARYNEDDVKTKRREFSKRKDGKKEKKDRGYMMFEEADSAEESLMSPEDEESRPQVKLKKHSKPSFKFVKKEKSYKPKEKEKEEKKKDEKKKGDKLKFKKKRIPSDPAIGGADDTPIFGVALSLAVARNKTGDGIQLPAMFRECIDYIEEFGLMCEGIYRISGVKSKVQALKDAYNKGLPVYLQEYEPNVVAGLIKQFLRELPEPVLTSELTPKFEQASTLKSVKQRVCEFQRLIELLPTCNRQLLSWVIVHMTHVIAKEKQNKMSVQNISIVLSPTMQISHRVLNILFTYSKILFRDTVIKKYVPALKPVTSRWSIDMPESPTSLEEEIRKQEVLLDELHREVMRVKDTEKEERLWEVQRVVTGLKRKLKLVKKGQNQSPSISRSTLVERSKEIVPRTKAEPPKKLNLKIGDDDIDLRTADVQSSKKQLQAAKLNVKGGKRVALKAVGTPTKDVSMDIGDIEVDSSAQSLSRRRRDSNELELREDVDTRSHFVPKPIDESHSLVHQSVSQENEENKVTKTKSNIATEHESSGTQKTECNPIQSKESDATNVSSVEQNVRKVDEEMKIVNQTTDKITEQDHTTDVAKTESDIDKDQAATKADTAVDLDTQQAKGEGAKIPSPVESDITPLSSSSLSDLSDSSSDLQSSRTDSDALQQVEKCTAQRKTSLQGPDVCPQDLSVQSSVVSSQSIALSSQQSDKLAQPSGVVSMPSITDTERESVTAPQSLSMTAGKEEAVLTVDREGLATDKAQAVPDAVMPGGVAIDKAGAAPVSSTPGGVAADELTAALNELVHSETEEDLNQRVMSQLFDDFGIERPAECDEEYEQLLDEYTALRLEEEELTIIGDELRAKIESEQYEIERLDEEITEVRAMREDLYSSDDKTDSSDSESDDDDETMLATLNKLMTHNAQLQAESKDLCNKIYQEVQDCLKTKVQIRMLQQKQIESSKNNELDLLL